MAWFKKFKLLFALKRFGVNLKKNVKIRVFQKVAKIQHKTELPKEIGCEVNGIDGLLVGIILLFNTHN